MRVLVIEDHPMNRQLLVAILTRHGIQALEAESAEQGISMAEKQNPTLILMDIGLPDMDGLTATRLLKSNILTAHIPILAVTAHAFKEDKALAMEAGCAEYLTKPISIPEVLEMLHKYDPSKQDPSSAAAE